MGMRKIIRLTIALSILFNYFNFVCTPSIEKTITIFLKLKMPKKVDNDAPTQKSKEVQRFLAFMSICRMSESGNVSNSDALNIRLLDMFTVLVDAFVSKSSSMECGSLFTCIEEWNSMKLTRVQLLRSKGETNMTGASVKKKGEEFRREVNCAFN